MEQRVLRRKKVREKRAMRVRKKLRGTRERPRLSVSKSLKHVGAQVIDDEAGITIVGFSTLSKEVKGKKRSKEGARFVGQKIAQLAQSKNVERVIFDRGRFKYHGIIAELADAARECGLKF